MGSSKLNTINDPLAQQKTAAANTGLGNYQTASSAVPSLQNFYNQNFGNTSGANVNPLLSAVSSSVLGDISGQGGPYTSLLQNTLGTFDTGEQQAQQGLSQQLQAQGFGGSGAGMAVLGNQGANAAQQRALLASQLGVNELDMANQLGLQQFNIGQQLGFTDPGVALEQIQSLASPPNLGTIDNTYYTPGNKFQTTADILGAATNAMSNGLFSPQSIQSLSSLGGSGNGAPPLAQPQTTPTNNYPGVQSMMNNPALLYQLMASMPVAGG